MNKNNHTAKIMDLKERFLKYVSYDTQSSEESGTFPSTEKQKVLPSACISSRRAASSTFCFSVEGNVVLSSDDWVS